jgi:ferrous iron transport protein B
MDEAKRNKLTIDERSLARDLGIPVVPTSARFSKGIPELTKTISEVADGTIKCKPHRIKNVPENINEAVKKLSIEIEKEFPDIPNSRWIAFRLLEGDSHIIDALKTGELV